MWCCPLLLLLWGIAPRRTVGGSNNRLWPVVWNSKWPQDCDDGDEEQQRRAKLLRDFFQVDINEDANYYGHAGSDIINTMGAFGAWPHFSQNDGVPINGGLPQRGNITLHLARVRIDIESYMPSADFAGHSVIDFEEWAPTFDANNYSPSGVVTADYQNMSRAWVLERHPSWNASQVQAVAREEFDAAARMFIRETLLLGKAMRPRAQWGYYGYPSCGKWHDQVRIPALQ